MRFNLPRYLVPATLAVAILIAPLPASAAPRDFGWGAVVGWANGLLRHLWAEEGVSIDPYGRPAATAPAANANDGRHLWAEEGASCDPLGRPAACVSGMTPEDNRQ
jgi:hypothetical protein